MAAVFNIPVSAIASDIDSPGFQTAADFLKKGLYLEAMGEYQSIAETSSSNHSRALALLFIGKTYSQYLDQYQSALEQFHKIQSLYPDSPSASDALFNSGLIFQALGQTESARAIFERYLQKYPLGMRRKSAEMWVSELQRQSPAAKRQETASHQAQLYDTNMRVLVRENADVLVVRAETGILVSDLVSEKQIYSGPGPLIFKKSAGGLSFKGPRLRELTLKEAICRVSAQDKALRLDDSGYRGFMTLVPQPKGLRVINHIPVEQYLYGVLPEEMPYTWPAEALRAQAVASRTYALYIKQKSADKPYDLETTTTSQVYGGVDAEKPASSAAVDATRNQVMLYDGRLIIAYFHANSAGHTEDAENVWGAAIPYLKGIPDRFSAKIPKSDWECYVPFDDLKNMLNAYDLGVRRVSRLQPTGKSGSGRALKILMVSDKGDFLMTSNNFRIQIGGTKLRSTLFQSYPRSRGILFRGQGYGHGVGMSQWGAHKMAQTGYTYREILAHYYTDVKIETISPL